MSARATNSDVEFALNEDAAALTEHVTITSDPFESTRTTATFEQNLNKRELQATSSILLSDPIRAAQTLPGSAVTMTFAASFPFAAPASIASVCGLMVCSQTISCIQWLVVIPTPVRCQ